MKSAFSKMFVNDSKNAFKIKVKKLTLTYLKIVNTPISCF